MAVSIDVAWMNYRAEKGFYEECVLGHYQYQADLGAAVPYAGIFGNIAGIFLDIFEIFSGFGIKND